MAENPIAVMGCRCVSAFWVKPNFGFLLFCKTFSYSNATFWGFMSFKYGALEVQHNLGMGVAICDLYLKNALDCNTHSQSCDQGQGWKFWEKVVMYAYH